MAQSKDLQYEYKAYEVEPVHGPKHTLEYLINVIERSISRDYEAEVKKGKQKEIDGLLAGKADQNLKLASEIKAEKQAEKQAQQERNRANQLQKQIGGAIQQSPPAAPEGEPRGRQRERGGKGTKEQAAGAQERKSSPARGDDKEKFFIGADGQHLQWLPAEQFKRVNSACFAFNMSTCPCTPAECLEKNGKKHDKLPKTLLPYLREPGKQRPRSASRPPRDASRSREEKPTRKPLPTRWDTEYCYRYADGTCKKSEEECGRPHLTEEAAKEKAGGKVAPRPAPKAKSSPRTPVSQVRRDVDALGARLDMYQWTI